jgi:phage baseplate assembly protein W
MAYSDLNSIDPTNMPLLTAAKAVYQSLFNSFNTEKGQRVFRPTFGFSFEDHLFELIDDLTSLEVKRKIITELPSIEPRIEIDLTKTKITPDPDNNQYSVDLVFIIKGFDGQSFRFSGNLRS